MTEEFDINKICIGNDPESDVELDFQGVPIKIRIRQLSWSKKNQILSNCFSYGSDGQMQFNFDRYMKEMLQAMIVKAPWGETNHIFLNKLNPAFGSILEKLVPKAFDEVKDTSFFVKG
jgi:hypothetical protein